MIQINPNANETLGTVILTMHNTGNRGYLQVPVGLLLAFDVATKISSSSYLHDGYAYLEKTDDGATFIEQASKDSNLDLWIADMGVRKHHFDGMQFYHSSSVPEVSGNDVITAQFACWGEFQVGDSEDVIVEKVDDITVTGALSHIRQLIFDAAKSAVIDYCKDEESLRPFGFYFMDEGINIEGMSDQLKIGIVQYQDVCPIYMNL